MERSTIFNGQIHYFDWAIFNSYVTNYQRVPYFTIFYRHLVVISWHWMGLMGLKIGIQPLPSQFRIKESDCWRHQTVKLGRLGISVHHRAPMALTHRPSSPCWCAWSTDSPWCELGPCIASWQCPEPLDLATWPAHKYGGWIPKQLPH